MVCVSANNKTAKAASFLHGARREWLLRTLRLHTNHDVKELSEEHRSGAVVETFALFHASELIRACDPSGSRQQRDRPSCSPTRAEQPSSPNKCTWCELMLTDQPSACCVCLAHLTPALTKTKSRGQKC